MSRLFYHVMQDNLGNLLFDVSGTMRLAGSGTLATIYGDDSQTVILPNPMTNHPSFASFKCYLAPGSYDFYMAKPGYSFETLTGLQGAGSMTQQNAEFLIVTGGTVSGLSSLSVTGTTTLGGPTQMNQHLTVAAPGHVGIGIAPGAHLLTVAHDKTSTHGIVLQPSLGDLGAGAEIIFNNYAGSGVGSIQTTATTTNYATTSDARLKYAVEALTGALDVVRRLRPLSYRWKADESAGVGFLAHEVQAWAPEAVTGEPDAVTDAGDIVPQGLDMSKLVPYLVGAVQMLAEQVQGLTARLTVVEDGLGV